MKKFVVHSFSVAIEEVEFERETAASLFNAKGHRVAKRSDWRNHFDTWVEARDFLFREQLLKVKRAEFDLMRAQEKLSQIRGLEDPAESALRENDRIERSVGRLTP